ncbi:amino acid adenylation domain-containing protein, partial [Tenacibaculum xiamenense]|uniref:amino acid adenylation domain-containing protein n=1 Tax=Tenacibaculum xiamenense TaxID=1261553 RepID=UPI0038B5490D
MNKALSIIKTAQSKGVTLELEEGSLVLKSENEDIDDALLVDIKLNKELIIEHLNKFDGDSISYKGFDKDAIQPFDRELIQKIPLSFNQDRIWFLDHLDGTQAYHIPLVMQLQGDVNINFVEKVLQSIVDRHEVLRTVIYEEDGVGYQKTMASDSWLLQKVITSEEANLKEQIRTFINLPFDLSKDYMLRSCLYDLGNEKYVLACVFHHIASDGWSTGILTSEFVELYSALRENRTAFLPELKLQYSDYAVWQRQYLDGEALESQLSYWKEKLSNASTLTLPLDYARPATQSTAGANTSLVLDNNLKNSLLELCQQEGVTLFMLLLSAFKVLLSRYSGQDDICVGTPIANRTQTDLEGMIGFFVNTLALRSDLSDNPTFKEFLQEVKNTTLDAYDHQLVPFEKVVDEIVTTRDMSMTPLYQAMFVLQNLPSISDKKGEGVSLGAVEISGYKYEVETSKTDLTITISEEDASINIDMEYCTALFNQSTIDKMLRHYKELLMSIVDNIQLPVNNLALLTKDEEAHLLTSYNETASVDFPENLTILDLFAEQVAKAPNAIALTFEGNELSYRDLDARSNQLAHYLRAQGVQPDTLVSICLERGFDMIVGILGILKSGGAYVPVDPAYPADRIEYTLADAGIELVLSDEVSKEVLKDQAKLNVLSLDGDWDTISSYSTKELSKVVSPSNLAYVIYTSGSTGKPKGVLIEHLNVVRLFKHDECLFDFDSNDVWTLFHSFCFDFSVWEMYGALLFGGRLVIVPKSITKDAMEFSNLLVNEGVTVLNQTPSSFYTLQDQYLSIANESTIRYVVFGGEALNPSYLARWKKSYINSKLINMYGITETTVHVTYKEITEADVNNSVSTIGTAIPTLSCYIVDDYLNLVPQGVIGELCVGGSGVARGYLNREVLTNERFVANPFSNDTNARLYKSGDLGRWLPDGTIEYIGRKDNQVKIRGYRIELGEIESVLSKVEGIHSSCVLAKEDGTGNKRLIGYIVKDEVLNKELIQSELKKSLPEYMVPQIWIELEEMPLTSNGKLDKKSLPEPDGAMLSTKEYVAPRNETETQIATIWQELLSLDKVGVYDNFFELGGHSLLVIQLISRLQKVDFHIEVRGIFSSPTIAEIAEKVSSEASVYQVPANGITKDTDRITPEMLPLLDFAQEDVDKIVSKIPGGVSNIEDIYPLAPLQEGMYFHHLMSNAQEGDAYILPNLLTFPDKEKRAMFIEALQFVVNRHDILRTSFLSEGLPKAVQVVQREAQLSLEHIVIDASKDFSKEIENLRTPGKQWMDISEAPLLKLRSIDDTENGDYHLLVNQHHLILDHVGLEKVISEIEMYLLGEGTKLPTPVSYRDFIGHTLYQQATNDSESYFTSLLEGVDTPSYPFGLSDIQGTGSEIKELRTVLPEDLSASIRKASLDLGMTPAVLFHAAYGLVVSKCSNANYALFGTLFSGRLQGSSGAADSLGLFINTLPFYIALEGSITEYVDIVKERLGQLMPYEQTPLSRIQGWSEVSNEVPLFNALLNFRHSYATSEEKSEGNGIDLGINFEAGEERTNYPFTLSVDDYGVDFGLTAQIDEHIDAARIIGYMEEALEQLIAGLNSKETILVRNAGILSREEELQLLEDFNITAVDYGSNQTILDLFSDHVKKSPNEIAVVYKGEELSYKELDQRSNQVGRYLQAQGVQSDGFVGICMTRSLEMIVGILGVLKSGGAYVPIDPNYPKDRIAYIIEDTGIELLLSNAESQNVLEDQKGFTSITLDTNWNQIAEYSTRKLSYNSISQENLAYVIYTSGSTGKPKGVLIEHGNMFNLVNWAIANFKDSLNLGMLASTSINFDLSIFEIFTSLASGAKIELVDNLLSLVEDSEVSVSLINTVPSVLLGVLESGKLPETVKTINLAGEPLLPSLVDRIYKESSVEAIYDLYGPSEATTYSTFIKRELNGVQTIGRPIANTQIYIVNDAVELVPVGVVGELCVGGKGVARGYLNREELTNEKFVSNPFKKGDRIYKTGDLARWLPDGTLEYVGRKDSQVKVRGYRIELGEIESVLSTIETIQSSCVLAKEDVTGSKRLVGYVVTEGKFNKEKVQAALKESLPEYMVPSLWVEMDEMPLTASGKLDRKALPELDGSLLSTKEYIAPRTELEEQIASIWKDVLGVEKVGVYDNFFELGGHSLLIVQLISRLQKVGFHITVKTIFSNPTIAGISENLASLNTVYQVPANGITEDTIQITPDMIPLVTFSQEDIDTVVSKTPGGTKNIQDIYPLSPLQEGMYFHYLMSDKEQGDPYITPNLLSFTDKEKRKSFIEALQFVVNRHDVLRTAILSKELPQAVQVVQREAKLHIEELVFDSEENILSELKDFVDHGKQWMDVSKAPLLELKIVDDISNDCYYLVINQHHLTTDHIGLEKVISEIEMYLLGKGDTLGEPVLYRDFIGHTLYQQSTNDSASYFKGLFGNIEAPSYPFGLSDVRGNGAEIKEVSIILPSELNKSLREISVKLGMSPVVLFHAAYGLVVGKYSNKDYAIFGTLFSGRLQGSVGAADSLGLFINTLPFLVDIEGSISKYVETVKGRLEDLLPYEQTPLSDIQAWSGVSNDIPLFSALLNYRHSATSSEREEDVTDIDSGISVISGKERTNYPFTLSVDDFGVDFGLTAQIDESIDANRVVSYMQEALEQLVEGLNSEEVVEVNSVVILPKEEEQLLLDTFNNTYADYPLDKTILDIFSDQVKQSSKKVAVVYKGEELSYKELDQRSNQVARYLQAKGIQTDGLVGICMERSLEMIVGMLGVLKSGGAYVPIDPNYPKERIEYIIEDTGIKLLLSNAASHEVLENKQDLTNIALDTDWNQISEYSTRKLSYKSILQDSLAYVIYTSGSTGKPKGVLIEHGNMFNMVNWAIDNFKDSLDLGMLASTSINFDLSIFEIFTSLALGTKIELVDNLLSLVEDSEVSVSLINTVPSVILGVLESGKLPETVKTINLAGEPLLPSLVDRIYKESSVEAIYDLYGPSEATTYSTFIKRELNGVQTIGRPISNTQIYILSESSELVPVGVIGELCVGGRGVARGYLNREELTNEKFISNPFKEGERIYKTGDLARWLPDGTLEYVGRKDNQVKIRGYRIELGEIENALSSLETISQCCVLAKEAADDSKRLVGYVVSEEAFDKEGIQIELKESLPDYMIPSIWVEMDEMPLTASGKLDRRALPEPNTSDFSTQGYVAPRNETEAQLVAVWQDILGVEKIGIYDNFFELGGHSLLIVQLISRLQKFDYHVEVKDIFTNPTVAGISTKVVSSSLLYQVPANGITEGIDRIVPEMVPLLGFDQEDIDTIVSKISNGISNIQDIYPLSPLQEGIYFHHLMSGKDQGDPYVLPNLLSFPSREKRELFVEALQFVVSRHDVLRTAILSEGLPKAVQVVLKEAQLFVEELTIGSDKDILSELNILTEPGNQWMDVSKAPLLSLKSADDVTNESYYLVLFAHHLVLDHVGLEKITAEIEVYLSGKSETLSTPVLYRDFIGHTLYQQLVNDSESYFTESLGAVEEPTYPFDLTDIQGNGSNIEESVIIISDELNKELREVSLKLGMSPAVLFHAAYGLVVGKCSNKEYALFGSLFSGRLQGSLGAADALGLFINTLPFYVSLEGNMLAYVKGVKQQLHELLPYEQTPLSNIQNWSGVSNEVPLFSALLNFRHSHVPTEEVKESAFDLGITVKGGQERTNYPLTLNVDDFGHGFRLEAQVDGGIADRLLSYMQEALTELLKGLSSEEAIEVNNVVILPKEEEQLLLDTFNNTEATYPLDTTILDLFSEQVKQSPKQIAVVYKGEALSYKELDRRSNQVARYLQAQGVQPDGLVGICMTRSLEMIVGTLGVLKSGGAYVPIDPNYPKERIEYIIEDTGIELVLSNEASQEV